MPHESQNAQSLRKRYTTKERKKERKKETRKRHFDVNMNTVPLGVRLDKRLDDFPRSLLSAKEKGK